MAEVDEPRRAYRSSVRAEQARRTRARVLDAARQAFTAEGYAATTMRAVAARAGVSVATVELAFGTKPALLKAAIDVAIAGDDEPVAVLDRDWTAKVLAADDLDEFLRLVVEILGPAQERSAGLVVAAFQGSALDDDLARLAARLTAQRAETASWIVDRIASRFGLRPELSHEDAVDGLWVLMDSVVFVQLTRHRGWSTARYQEWLARSVRNLLTSR